MLSGCDRRAWLGSALVCSDRLDSEPIGPARLCLGPARLDSDPLSSARQRSARWGARRGRTRGRVPLELINSCEQLCCIAKNLKQFNTNSFLCSYKAFCLHYKQLPSQYKRNPSQDLFATREGFRSQLANEFACNTNKMLCYLRSSALECNAFKCFANCEGFLRKNLTVCPNFVPPRDIRSLRCLLECSSVMNWFRFQLRRFRTL